MQELLFNYRLSPTTWAYLSSLLTVGIYFKFNRFWSVRNLDIAALIAFVPGLLLLYHGCNPELDAADQLKRFGYLWLFCTGAFFLIRLLLDPVMVRRPLLEPNLSAGGLTFTCASLLVFLMANIVTTNRAEDGPKRAERLEDVLSPAQTPHEHGPGYPYFHHFARFTEDVLDPIEEAPPATDSVDPPPRRNSEDPDSSTPLRVEELPTLAESPAPDTAQTAGDEKGKPEAYRRARARNLLRRIVAILAHLAVVVGVVLIGYRHFDNIHTGVAVASLYLLSFYTSQMVGRVDHVVPAALLVWAVQAYRRPVVAGVLIATAGGLIYYPLFLLPLWCGFYWRRGLIRFAIAVVSVLLVMVLLLWFTPDSLGPFSEQLARMFGWMNPLAAERCGFWEEHEPVFRIPVLAAFVALCGSLALWPAQKNLGTLLSCSAAVMLGTQFWQAHQGGVFMAWYLPLLLLTVFRPNLEDRVAFSALTECRVFRRTHAPAP